MSKSLNHGFNKYKDMINYEAAKIKHANKCNHKKFLH